jgi:hypothetical protein
MTSTELRREIQRIHSQDPVIGPIEEEKRLLFIQLADLGHRHRVACRRLYNAYDVYRDLVDNHTSTLREEVRARQSTYMGATKRKMYLEQFAKIVPVEAKDEGTTCVVCAEFEKCICFGPCGHKAVCSVCATKILKDRLPCPMCRKKIAVAQQVFE